MSVVFDLGEIILGLFVGLFQACKCLLYAFGCDLAPITFIFTSMLWGFVLRSIWVSLPFH